VTLSGLEQRFLAFRSNISRRICGLLVSAGFSAVRETETYEVTENGYDGFGAC